jgi:hypothetical protein
VMRLLFSWKTASAEPLSFSCTTAPDRRDRVSGYAKSTEKDSELGLRAFLPRKCNSSSFFVPFNHLARLSRLLQNCFKATERPSD